MIANRIPGRLILTPADFGTIVLDFVEQYSRFLLPEGSEDESSVTPVDLVIAVLYPVHHEKFPDPMLWLSRLLALGNGPILGNPVPGTEYDFYANPYEAFQGFVQEHLITHVEAELGLGGRYVDLTALHDAGVNIYDAVDRLAAKILSPVPVAVQLAESMFVEPPLDPHLPTEDVELTDTQLAAILKRI